MRDKNWNELKKAHNVLLHALRDADSVQGNAVTAQVADYLQICRSSLDHAMHETAAAAAANLDGMRQSRTYAQRSTETNDMSISNVTCMAAGKFRYHTSSQAMAAKLHGWTQSAVEPLAGTHQESSLRTPLPRRTEARAKTSEGCLENIGRRFGKLATCPTISICSGEGEGSMSASGLEAMYAFRSSSPRSPSRGSVAASEISDIAQEFEATLWRLSTPTKSSSSRGGATGKPSPDRVASTFQSLAWDCNGQAKPLEAMTVTGERRKFQRQACDFTQRRLGQVHRGCQGRDPQRNDSYASSIAQSGYFDIGHPQSDYARKPLKAGSPRSKGSPENLYTYQSKHSGCDSALDSSMQTAFSDGSSKILNEGSPQRHANSGSPLRIRGSSASLNADDSAKEQLREAWRKVEYDSPQNNGSPDVFHTPASISDCHPGRCNLRRALDSAFDGVADSGEIDTSTVLLSCNHPQLDPEYFSAMLDKQCIEVRIPEFGTPRNQGSCSPELGGSRGSRRDSISPELVSTPPSIDSPLSGPCSPARERRCFQSNANPRIRLHAACYSFADMWLDDAPADPKLQNSRGVVDSLDVRQGGDFCGSMARDALKNTKAPIGSLIPENVDACDDGILQEAIGFLCPSLPVAPQADSFGFRRLAQGSPREISHCVQNEDSLLHSSVSQHVFNECRNAEQLFTCSDPLRFKEADIHARARFLDETSPGSPAQMDSALRATISRHADTSLPSSAAPLDIDRPLRSTAQRSFEGIGKPTDQDVDLSLHSAPRLGVKECRSSDKPTASNQACMDTRSPVPLHSEPNEADSHSDLPLSVAPEESRSSHDILMKQNSDVSSHSPPNRLDSKEYRSTAQPSTFSDSLRPHQEENSSSMTKGAFDIQFGRAERVALEPNYGCADSMHFSRSEQCSSSRGHGHSGFSGKGVLEQNRPLIGFGAVVSFGPLSLPQADQIAISETSKNIAQADVTEEWQTSGESIEEAVVGNESVFNEHIVGFMDPRLQHLGDCSAVDTTGCHSGDRTENATHSLNLPQAQGIADDSRRFQAAQLDGITNCRSAGDDKDHALESNQQHAPTSHAGNDTFLACEPNQVTGAVVDIDDCIGFGTPSFDLPHAKGVVNSLSTVQLEVTGASVDIDDFIGLGTPPHAKGVVNSLPSVQLEAATLGGLATSRSVGQNQDHGVEVKQQHSSPSCSSFNPGDATNHVAHDRLLTCESRQGPPHFQESSLHGAGAFGGVHSSIEDNVPQAKRVTDSPLLQHGAFGELCSEGEISSLAEQSTPFAASRQQQFDRTIESVENRFDGTRVCSTKQGFLTSRLIGTDSEKRISVLSSVDGDISGAGSANEHSTASSEDDTSDVRNTPERTRAHVLEDLLSRGGRGRTGTDITAATLASLNEDMLAHRTNRRLVSWPGDSKSRPSLGCINDIRLSQPLHLAKQHQHGITCGSGDASANGNMNVLNVSGEGGSNIGGTSGGRSINSHGNSKDAALAAPSKEKLDGEDTASKPKGAKGKGKGQEGKGKDGKGKNGKGKDGKGKDGKGKDGKGKDGKGKALPAVAKAKAKAKSCGPEPRKADVTPRNPMKKLFWNSFVLDEEAFAMRRRTIWGAIDEDGMEEFDVNELEEMFCAKETGRKSLLFGEAGHTRRNTRVRVRVFEESRRRQVCVMLARLPSIDETIQAVLEMDDVRLNKDQVELLLANAPPTEEITALRNTAAEKEHEKEHDHEFTSEEVDWDDAEAFILRLSGVPSFALRLQMWAFENSFDERFDFFQQAAIDVKTACTVLQQSPRIQRLLSLALSVGNYLNGGTSRGRADGFTVEALAQMRTVKASKPGLSLVDYMVEQLERSHPQELEALFLEGGEAQVVRKAMRHKLADLNVELSAYIAQADGLVKRVATSRDDELDIRGLRVESRMRQLTDLLALFGQADEDYHQLCTWFHDGQHLKRERPPDEFFTLWYGFLEAVRVALENVVAGKTSRKRSVSRARKTSQRLKRSLSNPDVTACNTPASSPPTLNRALSDTEGAGVGSHPNRSTVRFEQHAEEDMRRRDTEPAGSCVRDMADMFKIGDSD